MIYLRFSYGFPHLPATPRHPGISHLQRRGVLFRRRIRWPRVQRHPPQAWLREATEENHGISLTNTNINSYGHLSVITGYFSGIIHSINGVLLVLITGISGHN